MVTDAALEAINNLRALDNLQWYIIPLIVLIVYIYNTEIEKKNLDAVFLGIYWFCIPGVVLEIINALVLHFTQYSALWLTPGNSAYTIYVGWNIEIAFLAAIIGLMNVKGIPKDRKAKIFGLPNRIILPIIWGVVSLFIEVLLNFSGILVWDWWFWNFPNLFIPFLWWTIPNYVLIWLYDHLSLQKKKLLAGISVIVALVAHIVFAVILQWV